MASQRICSVDGCGKPHKSKGLCNAHYLDRYRAGRSAWPRCSVEGCDHQARSARSPYCEMHYGRLRRNGTLDQIPPPQFLGHSGGYRLVYAPDHPLRDGKVGNYEYEHRVVFYDEHGEGPFSCHHCGVTVTWEDMHVDHLNDVTDDNRSDNLVASCAVCNPWRGKGKMRQTMRQKHARTVTWNGTTKTLAEWAEDIGIDRESLQWRLKAGWPLDRALTEPRGKTGPRRRHADEGEGRD